MANFQDILNQPADDLKPPQALPTGTYLCIIDGQPEIAKVGKKETDAVIFNFKPVQATGDVDQQQLLTVLEGAALADKKIRYTMWGSPDAAYRIKNFLHDHLHIPSTNLGQMIPQAMGKQCLVNIGHRTDGNPPQIYMDVKSTASA